jgi:nuclear transport factor 2 (NTF2) superfamily protein
MQLTKEYLDKALEGLATRDDLDERFEKQTRILMAYTDDQVGKLAAMVADGFEEVKELLDVRERMTQLEKDMRNIKEALHV